MREFEVMEKLTFTVAGVSKKLNRKQRQGSDYIRLSRPLEGVWVVLDLTETMRFSAGLKAM